MKLGSVGQQNRSVRIKISTSVGEADISSQTQKHEKTIYIYNVCLVVSENVWSSHI